LRGGLADDRNPCIGILTERKERKPNGKESRFSVLHGREDNDPIVSLDRPTPPGVMFAKLEAEDVREEACEAPPRAPKFKLATRRGSLL
jgi:hypothetical protein